MPKATTNTIHVATTSVRISAARIAVISAEQA
jgi:hypothetical protein